MKALLFIGLLTTVSSGLFAQGMASFRSAGKTVEVRTFDQEMKTMMKVTGVPAVSVAIIDSNQIVFSNIYGIREKEGKRKANRRTVFEGASLTKIFLVYVVNKLVDEGRFDLDKPMYLYLRDPDLEYDPRYLKITPRMIMCHTSGLENWKSEHDPKVLEILHDPGTQFEYSGEGYQYLAKVIEKVLNEPYLQYVDDMVIRPFHLKRTYMNYKRHPLDPFEKGVAANYAIGYDDHGGIVHKWKPYSPVPASGVQTTAKALAKLVLGIFAENNLSPARLDSMEVPLVDKPDYGQQAGLGFWLVYTASDSVLFFGGVNSGFRAFMFYSIKYKRGFVYQSNSDTGWQIILELNRLTAQLGIEHLFKGMYFMEYPSTYVTLQDTYREQGADAFLRGVDSARSKGAVDSTQLKALADWIRSKDNKVAGKLMDKASASN